MRDTERLRRRIEEWFTMPIEGHGLWCRYEDAREMLDEVLPLLAAPTPEPERPSAPKKDTKARDTDTGILWCWTGAEWVAVPEPEPTSGGLPSPRESQTTRSGVERVRPAHPEPERCPTCGQDDSLTYPCPDSWHSGVGTTNQENATHGD